MSDVWICYEILINSRCPSLLLTWKWHGGVSPECDFFVWGHTKALLSFKISFTVPSSGLSLPQMHLGVDNSFEKTSSLPQSRWYHQLYIRGPRYFSQPYESHIHVLSSISPGKNEKLLTLQETCCQGVPLLVHIKVYPETDMFSIQLVAIPGCL